MTKGPVLAIIDAEADRYADALADLPYEIRVYADAVVPPEADLSAVAYALAAPDRLATYLPFLPSLRWAQSTWAGVNPLLSALRARPEVAVSALKGPFGALMVRYMNFWLDGHEQGLLVALSAQRRGRWAHGAVRRQSAAPFRGTRAVVLGTGAIGAALGGALQARGYVAVGLNRGGTPAPGFQETWPIARRLEALAGASVVISVLPATPDTAGLLDEAALATLAPGALLMNVGRGSVLQRDAVLGALADGTLGAAVLDVFEEEPLPADHPFWTAPRCFVTPHISAPTEWRAVLPVFRENFERVRAGQPPSGLVDPERGY
jgi:phosphoglycerate dehydrogenase-like enzyme